MLPLLSRLRLPFFITILLASFTVAACVRPVPDTDAPTPVLTDPATPSEGEPTTPTDSLTDTVEITPPLTDTVLPPGSVPSGTIDIAPPESPTDSTTEPTEGSEPTPPDTETVTGPPATTHVVQAGETLLTISQIYGVTIQDIAVANNLTNVNILSVGQELTIPEPGFAESQAAEPPTDDTGAEGGETAPTTPEQLHVVQRGDTLYSIGRAYGFTIDELVAYNNLANPDALQIGDEIRIPPR